MRTTRVEDIGQLEPAVVHLALFGQGSLPHFVENSTDGDSRLFISYPVPRCSSYL